MAKKCMAERELKRKKLVAKFAIKRRELVAIVKSLSSTDEEKEKAQILLQKLPRNSSATRTRNRCRMTGRPRGAYRKFGLSRNKLREKAMSGEIPGLVMASW